MLNCNFKRAPNDAVFLGPENTNILAWQQRYVKHKPVYMYSTHAHMPSHVEALTLSDSPAVSGQPWLSG